MRKISPCLWFEMNAEEAVNFYVSAFPRSKITQTFYYGEGAPAEPGSVMFITFELNGSEFNALNGGPWDKPNGAVSFVVPCETQREIDEVWDKLADGGEPRQCGWISDKYGYMWQIVSVEFMELLSSGEKAKIQAMTEAMYKMVKLNIDELKKAYDAA